MRRRVRVLAVAALLAPTLLVSTAAPCRACTCVPRTPGAVLQDADLVFVGEVVGDRLVGQGTAQRFRVDRVVVGAMPPEVEIYTAIGPDMVDSCAVLFSPGEPVAVALTLMDDGSYQTSSCALISVATVERILGEGSPPDPAAVFPAIPAANEGQRPDWRPTWWMIVGAGLLLAVVLIVVATVRGRRRDAGATTEGLPEDVPPPAGHPG